MTVVNVGHNMETTLSLNYLFSKGKKGYYYWTVVLHSLLLSVTVSIKTITNLKICP